MLLGSGRHSRRRGERRRRAEAAADAAATRLFPLTLDGFDDSWADDAPAGDGPVPWWLDVDDEDVVLAAVVPTAAAARGGTEQVAGLDRYSAEFDLPFVVPTGRPGKEVGGGTANLAGMPDSDDPPRPGGGDAGRDWSGPPVGTDDTVRDDTVRDVDEEPVDPWAAVEDERAASGDPWADGAEPAVEVDPRPTAPAAPVFDDDWEAALGADPHASGPADGPPGADGDGGARRYVFLEAATRYATDDETFGIDGDPATDDPAAHAHAYVDGEDEDHGDVTVVGGAPVPPPPPPQPPLADRRRAGGRRALLAAVPLVLIAAAGAVWAATSSSGPDGDDRTATRVAAPETTTTSVPTFGLSVEPVVPPVDTTATTAPPPPTTLPWANRTTTTVRQPTTATTSVTTTVATVAPTPVTPPATVAPTTTTAPPTTVATTTTAPPTTAPTTTAPTTTTTTTTAPPTTTTAPGDPPPP